MSWEIMRAWVLGRGARRPRVVEDGGSGGRDSLVLLLPVELGRRGRMLEVEVGPSLYFS